MEHRKVVTLFPIPIFQQKLIQLAKHIPLGNLIFYHPKVLYFFKYSILKHYE